MSDLTLKPMIIKCRKCKTKIVMDHPNRRLCIECKNNNIKERNKQKNRKPFYKSNKAAARCIVCGDEFFGLANNRKVCGHNCKMIRQRIQVRSKKNFGTIKVNLFRSWVMWGEK